MLIGGFDDKRKATSSVEMLNCPWDTEGDAGRPWKMVAPMHQDRKHHGACFFEGKIFAAGGKNNDSVECFVLPSVAFHKDNGQRSDR